MLLTVSIILTIALGLVVGVFLCKSTNNDGLVAFRNAANVKADYTKPRPGIKPVIGEDPVEKVLETEHKCLVELSNGKTLVCRARTDGEGDFDEINDFIFWYEEDNTPSHKLSLPEYGDSTSSTVVFNRSTIVSIAYTKETNERLR